MRKKVLLVEDNVADRNMYGNILWYNGYDTLYAGDGEAALKLIAAEHPDLIILDLELPRIHGLEVLSRTKQDEDTEDIPIVALTGWRRADVGADPRLLGYAAFLEKPASPLDVLFTVERLIGRAQSDQAEVLEKPAVVTIDDNDVTTIQIRENEDNTTELQRIGAHLKANVEGVCTAWEDLVRQEPWFSLPREDRVNNIRNVIDAIATAAMVAVDEPGVRRRIVKDAAIHGENRRRQQIPESLLPTEFHLLSRAIWHYLSESWRAADDTFTAILEIDALTTLALNAAMWGYFRDEVDGQVVWDAAIEKLIAPVNRFDKEPA